MESEFDKRFKESLLELGVKEDAIGKISKATKIASLFREPIKLVPLLRDMNIPFSEYLGSSLDYSFSKDNFVRAKLTETGAERVKEVGRYMNRGQISERAEKLAQLGLNKGMAALYFELTVGDLDNLYAYELMQRTSKQEVGAC